MGSRLDQIVARLSDKEVRDGFLYGSSTEPSVTHTFQVDDTVVHYIRGFTKHGSVFEAYVPEEQSGTVISYVAGLCVKPSIITTNGEATKVFGDDTTRHMPDLLLEEVNQTGYYGNTQLRLALEGRASVTVFEVGFDRSERNFVEMVLDRVIDGVTAKNQFLDAIALGGALGKTVPRMPSYRSGVTLATHSVATKEFLRFVFDSDRYVGGDDYVNADLVRSFIPHALYVNPHEATRNALFERTLRKGGASISLNPERSKFWVPAFWLLNVIDGAVEGFTPFDSNRILIPAVNPYIGAEDLQVNMDHCKMYPDAWVQGHVLNWTSAGYALGAPDEFIKPLSGIPDSNRLSAQASHFIGTRSVMYVVPGADGICSSESQQKFATDINAWMDRDSRRTALRDTLVLEGLGHNPFVDYGASDSVIMQSRKEYIRRVVALTTI